MHRPNRVFPVKTSDYGAFSGVIDLLYGKGVARRWRDGGANVYVVTRSPRRAADLESEGFQSVVADVIQPDTLIDLPAVETVLFAVGFDRSSQVSIGAVYAGGVRNVLAALPAKVRRFIYISTTGVYGPAGGAWVDENTTPDPRRDGGKASLAAEQQIVSHPLAKCTAILRLAGIYGPGRIPYFDKLRSGPPIAVPSRGWLNLIHVDDAAAVVLAADAWAASESADAAPHIFCVSDGEPVVRGNYYREVARRIGAPEPSFVEPDAATPAAARAAANKRIRNEKMSRTLEVRLTYPSYREGLAAILAS